jgi:UDP:flavonoid glycosyltransferase YjiC (YdhE family)
VRVLFTCLPRTGHFHPLVPIAQALRAAGHDVRFASGSDLAAQVAAAGFPFFPAGTNPGALAEEIPELDGLSGPARRELLRTRVMPEILPMRRLPALLELAEVWPPDLVVSENCEFAGRVAAEHWGIPHATVQAAHAYPYAGRHTLVAAMNLLRAGVGLPPDPDAAMLFRYLYLICEPPFFQPPGEELPPTARFLRRVPFDRSGDESLAAWVLDLPAQPTVFATLGTAVNQTPGIFPAILEGLGDAPINLILAVGRDADPGAFGQQPPNVHIERYIPQSLLFPHCDLVVSHGGSGTILTALSYGLPLVNIPIGSDQPENATRCTELGVGVTVPLAELSPEAIRRAVREVLSNPGYRARAERLRDEMAAMPGPEHAVALLERLAVERQPMTST